MDPDTCAQVIAERFDVGEHDRKWIAWMIRLCMPRRGDPDATPRVRTLQGMPQIGADGRPVLE